MKKQQLLFSIGIACALVFSSCSDDGPATNSGLIASNAQIENLGDGYSFTARP